MGLAHAHWISLRLPPAPAGVPPLMPHPPHCVAAVFHLFPENRFPSTMMSSSYSVLRFLGATAAALLCSAFAFALPVVPGAVGFGTDSPAGRGGIVYRVTNLNNSGPGEDILSLFPAAARSRVEWFPDRSQSRGLAAPRQFPDLTVNRISRREGE